VALRAPNFAVQNCDLLIAVGCRLDNIVTAYNPRNFARARASGDRCGRARACQARHENRRAGVRGCARRYSGTVRETASAHRPRNRQPWLDRCADWKRRYPVIDGKAFPTSGQSVTTILSIP